MAKKAKKTEKVETKVIRCELNKAAEESETDEEFVEKATEELNKLAALAGPNWRDAFK